MIASIAEKPSRGYKPVRYEWDYIDTDMYKACPFFTGYKTLQISQNIDDKAVFDILLGKCTEFRLPAVECEKLELALLAVEGIEVEEW